MSDDRAHDEDALSDEQLAELEAAFETRALVRGALAVDDDAGDDADDARAADRDAALLASVQRKLRARSKGKFYGDGWSTSGARRGPLLAAAVMLAIVIAVYLALGPTALRLR